MREDGRAGFSDQPTKFIESNGISVAYETFGDPQSPALVLVAGLNWQLVRWSVAFCDLLVERGFFVIRFDNRDIGLTDRIDDMRAPSLLRQCLKRYFGVPVTVPYTLGDMANDTIGLLDALGLPAAHLVGMSMGGMISQIAAAKYSSRVLSLTSMMSTSGTVGKGQPGVLTMIQMLKKPSKSQSVLDVSVETLQFIGSPSYPVSDRAVRATLLAESKRARSRASYPRQIAAINTAGNRIQLLSQVSVPALIIHGEEDRLVPVSGALDTARHIPHATLKLFAGLGHNLPDELLPEFADLIAANAGH